MKYIKESTTAIVNPGYYDSNNDYLDNLLIIHPFFNHKLPFIIIPFKCEFKLETSMLIIKPNYNLKTPKPCKDCEFYNFKCNVYIGLDAYTHIATNPLKWASQNLLSDHNDNKILALMIVNNEIEL